MYLSMSNWGVSVWRLHWIFKSRQAENSSSRREISTFWKKGFIQIFGVNFSLENPFLFTTSWGNWNDQLTPLASAALHGPLWVPVMLRVSFIQPGVLRLSWHAAGQQGGSPKFKGFPQVCNREENALGVMKYLENELAFTLDASVQTSQEIEQKQQNGWWNLGRI